MSRTLLRTVFGALGLATVATIGAGLSASAAQTKFFNAGLRPAPAATYVIGTAPGPLFYVQNNGTAPYDTFGVAGAAGAGPDAIGVLGYGASTTHANLALTGYDVGPGSVASVGYAAFPEPGSGPGSTATTGVLGIAPDGVGVMGQTSVAHGAFDGAGVSSYAGVVGVDNTDNGGDNAGVIGITTNGAYGIEGVALSFGSGVLAQANEGDGVDAYSAGGYGVAAVNDEAESSALYAQALNASADAIDATTIGPYGISAFGATIGAYGSSTVQGVWGAGNRIGTIGQATQAGAWPLVLLDHSLSSVFYVDDHGNVFQRGTTSTFVSTSSGGVGRMFNPKSTMQTMEDFGSSAIANGSAVVRLDAAFAQVIDAGGYQVFLTPNGDCNGLYVAQKNATSFVVRELRGGRSTLAFDYRIVARQYGHAADRVAIAQNAGAFGGPKVNPAPLPAYRPAGSRATFLSRIHAPSSAKKALQSPFPIPRAAAGLSESFGH